MAKMFGGSFPGNASVKGNAHVIDDGFEPGDTPPVDASAAPEAPVTPETGPLIDLPTGLPIIPFVEALEEAPVDDGDLPDEVPDFLFG